MALSTAERQRRHREKLKNKGLVRVQGWVTPERAAIITALIEGAALESVLPLPSPPAPPQAGAETTARPVKKPVSRTRKTKAKKEKTPSDERYGVVRDHHAEIEALARQGKKPSEIAAILTEKTGVPMSGGFLNSAFGAFDWWRSGKG